MPLRTNQAIEPLITEVKTTIAICFQFFNSPTFSARSGSFADVDSRFDSLELMVLISPFKSENPTSTFLSNP
jgi:hypothetical protein